MRTIVKGIYQIRNLTTGKVFISSSDDILREFEDHKDKLESGEHTNYLLQKDWRKTNGSGFKFEILEEANDENVRIEREQIYILESRCFDSRRGYNMSLFAKDSQSKLPDYLLSEIRNINSDLSVRWNRNINRIGPKLSVVLSYDNVDFIKQIQERSTPNKSLSEILRQLIDHCKTLDTLGYDVYNAKITERTKHGKKRSIRR